mmetsp:Transcript_6760/g.18124  ORF Transcript_6760/g.18124 Transcript_6760/m.18124 type:complete len:443 (-) Transcript_6760:1802-3130(-)|eukprot:CAMPEP_0202358890 /NCGR_PEP_ID=MMETSP1126-20121109/12390_1 /ASSEMBLY_ACC=CAM_ASM_000457 /TAXON_ID=3047 /ORGANISM="Dunaliella tertiolecta, Strain CCMP1320" /LENGTH=442 /DNA_ID=CAMNT_0048952169 /DNA_START=313 /DNA_END=1641 /DNA_ORIENTATION=+
MEGGANNFQADDDEVVEQDPEGRYYRYRETVGRGRFKQVWKAFDTLQGIDVAWSKISADSGFLHFSEEQLGAVVADIQKGLELEHPNIIKCYKCWTDNGSINLITELFTSGNLRQYRNLHKHLDLKAVKRMARQILRGLEYLHSMQPPVTHGDLRCDKIYVNGHSGEIKIGDLGLATLLPYRWQEEQLPPSAPSPPPAGAVAQPPLPPSPCISSQCKPDLQGPIDPATDIFAFGLCLLELLTLKQLDPQRCNDYIELLADVPDEDSRVFVQKCVAPVEQRPSAVQLLEDPFLSTKKSSPTTGEGDALLAGSGSSKGLAEGLMMEKRKPEESRNDPQSESGAPIAVGKLRGEDYNFEFHGKVKDGKMHFRLVMTEAAAAEPNGEHPPFMRTIDFVFDPEIDTADNLAAEISENFNLSPTDTEICAAALREWLAKEMPGTEGQK